MDQPQPPIPDGYELIGDEYVHKDILLSEREIQKQIETNVPSFFNKMGYKMMKVPQTKHIARTVDYDYEDLGLEVTSIREYLPRNDEVDKLLVRHEQTNSRICAYMFLQDGKPKIEILDEKPSENNQSILCLRQHVTCYRPKIIGKIIDKYSQDEDHRIQIIAIDFRLAHFDPLSLKTEIKTILTSVGMEFPALAGILVCTPTHLNSDMLSDESYYVFINNSYCNSQHPILEQLNNFSFATTSYWLTVNQIFIKKPSNLLTISFPCFDCPDKDELERRGLPTFQL